MKRVFQGQIEVKNFGEVPGLLFLSVKIPFCAFLAQILTSYRDPYAKCKLSIGDAPPLVFEGKISAFVQMQYHQSSSESERGIFPTQELFVGTSDLFDVLSTNAGKSCRLEIDL